MWTIRPACLRRTGKSTPKVLHLHSRRLVAMLQPKMRRQYIDCRRATKRTQFERERLPMALNNAPDLTKRPPRSPRVRLGGYVILPRMLDKGRAAVAGTPGEYHYNCPMDQGFLE